MKYIHITASFSCDGGEYEKRSDLLNYLCIHHVTSKQRENIKSSGKILLYSFITPSHITYKLALLFYFFVVVPPSNA